MVYDYHQGPCTDGSCWIDDTLHLNCQLWAHIVLEELGLPLPKWLRSAELYRRSSGGKVWVDRVDHLSTVRVGDIFLFSPIAIRNIQDPQIFQIHLGICLCATEHLICHASKYDDNGQWTKNGALLTQPLSEIVRASRYNAVVGIRRVRQ